MRLSLRLPTGLALAAAFTFAATVTQAQQTATMVLKSGDRHTGTNLGYRLDQREVAVRTSPSQEPRVPVDQVAYVDYGGTSDPDNLNLSGSQEAVVLRDGSIIKGQVIELGHVDRGDQKTPYLVVFRTEGGEERRLNVKEVGRVYFAGGASRRLRDKDDNTVSPSAGSSVARGINVAGNRAWTTTGLSVRRGEPLTINASGQVKIGGNDGQAFGPGGASETHPNNPIPSAQTGTLIGRIGNGAPFVIGTSNRIQAPAAGQLFLGINDSYFNDNFGNFDVEIGRVGSNQ
jgi:hypothetical protein